MSPTPITLFILVWIGSDAHVSAGDAFPFLPFGSGTPDISTYDKYGNSLRRSLHPNFKFMGTTFSEIYTHSVGGSVRTATDKEVCGLCSNIDVTRGKVWHRLSEDPADLQKVAELAQQYYLFGSCYTPVWVYVSTWDDVGTASDKRGSTFQIAVATDGEKSFVVFDYNTVTQTALYTVAGIVYESLQFNLTTEYSVLGITLPVNSNIGVLGRFLLRVDEKVDLPTSKTDRCKGQCLGEECVDCLLGEFYSFSQKKCVAKCSPCSQVGKYVEYPGMWWEGSERFLRDRFQRSNATTARWECEAKCSDSIFCIAFTLMENEGSTECMLLQYYRTAGEFRYNHSGAAFFHKTCK